MTTTQPIRAAAAERKNIVANLVLLPKQQARAHNIGA